MSTTQFITLFSEPEAPPRSPFSVPASVLVHLLLLGIFSIWLMVHVPVVNNKLIAKNTHLQVLNLKTPEPLPTPVQFQKHLPVVHTPRPAPKLGVVKAPPSPQVEQAKAQPEQQPAQQPAQPKPTVAAAEKPAPPKPVTPKPVVQKPSATVAISKPPTPPPAPTLTPTLTLATTQPVIIARTAVTQSPPPADVKLSPTEFAPSLPQMPSANLVVELDSSPHPANEKSMTPATPAATTPPATQLAAVQTPAPPAATPPTLQTQATATGQAPAADQTTPAASPAATSDTSLAELHMSDAGISAPAAGGAPSAAPADSEGITQAAGNPAGTPTGTSTDRIELPKNGQYGVVVMGASLSDEFPEASTLWGGRMPYTVYVHVGLAKSWILQYSLPRAASAAAVGTDDHLVAPWPYDIMRPNLPPGTITQSSVMVHGFVDKNGRFETLAVVSPQQFPQEKFVLDALRQWQFRPAEENGQNTDVEVLLIIPDELN